MGKVHSMRNAGKNRRKFHRIPLPKKWPALISSAGEGLVLDLSANGALVELFRALPAGGTCSLTLPLGEHSITLKARVARSIVSDAVRTTAGERNLIYRSGLEFFDLSPPDQEILRGFLNEVARMERPPGGPRKRQALRAKVDFPFVARLKGEATGSLRGRIANLGLGGLLASFPRILEPGTQLRLEIHSKRRTAKVDAEVVWREATAGQPPYRHGLKFLKPDLVTAVLPLLLKD